MLNIFQYFKKAQNNYYGLQISDFLLSVMEFQWKLICNPENLNAFPNPYRFYTLFFNSSVFFVCKDGIYLSIVKTLTVRLEV